MLASGWYGALIRYAYRTSRSSFANDAIRFDSVTAFASVMFVARYMCTNAAVAMAITTDITAEPTMTSIKEKPASRRVTSSPGRRSARSATC